MSKLSRAGRGSAASSMRAAFAGLATNGLGDAGIGDEARRDGRRFLPFGLAALLAAAADFDLSFALERIDMTPSSMSITGSQRKPPSAAPFGL